MTDNFQKPVAIVLSFAIVLLASMLCFYGSCFSGTGNNSTVNEVFVVPVSGTVDPGMAGYIKRVYHKVSEKHRELWI